jgi:TP901 family phage tail tape measure protein
MIRKDEVQLEVVANGNPARKALAELDMEAQKLKNTMRDNKRGTEAYIEASKKLKDVEQNMAKVRKEIGLNQMTLKELNKELSSLKNKRQFIDPMTDAFKENRKAIEAVIARKKELETGLGKFGQAINSIKKELMFVGVAGATAAVYAGISNIIKVNVEFEKSLRNLQAITGVGIQDLQFYAAAAKNIGLTTTTSASDAVEAFKLIASAKPDLLNAKEALVSVTKEAINLANASGLSLPEAATRLTDAMNQFSAPAREAGKYVNILAEGARLSAAEVPDITSALLEFGVAAKSSNVSISESVALIETMAEKGVKGAEAGTKLRNVLAKGFSPKGLDKAAIADLERMGVNLDVLSNKNLSLQDRLQELSKIKNDDIALTRVFGLENKIAAQVILENTGRVNELSVALGKDGLSTAADQAATNMDTLASAGTRFTNTWNAVTTDENGGLNGLLKGFVNWATKAVLAMDHILTRANFGKIKDRRYNEGTAYVNKATDEFRSKANDMGAKELADTLMEEQKMIMGIIAKRNELKEGQEYDLLGQALVLSHKKKAIIYENLKQIQDAEVEAAKKSEAITKATVDDAGKKIKQVEDHISKIKKLHSEFFKLTGYETEKEFFDAMDKENAYQDKLAASRAAEPGERDRQNNIDLFGFGSLSEMGNVQGDADVQNDKDAADKAKREAKEEEERQAFLKLEKDKQDAQAETFGNWFKHQENKINKELNNAQAVQGLFVAFDNFKRVKENAEIARLGENSEAAKRIRIEQAKREKKLALAEIAIKTAMNVVAQFPNYLMMALAASTGIAQAAAVSSTPIPEAKYGKKRVQGPSHSQGGMNVIDGSGRPVLNIEGGEGIIPGATVDANEHIIDAMLSNYGKPLSMDWLYKNSTANVRGFSANSSSNVINNTTVNNQSSSTGDGMKELTNSVKRMEQALNNNNSKPVTLGLYDLRKKQKEMDIIERNAGSF